ncbi:hypothetical protein PQR65_01005 [Paraburkholderia nemoris]
MLMPDKHIRLSESLFGLGGYALSYLSEPRTVDELWQLVSGDIRDGEYPSQHSFESLVLAVDVLYAIGAIYVRNDGALIRCN